MEGSFSIRCVTEVIDGTAPVVLELTDTNPNIVRRAEISKTYIQNYLSTRAKDLSKEDRNSMIHHLLEKIQATFLKSSLVEKAFVREQPFQVHIFDDQGQKQVQWTVINKMEPESASQKARREEQVNEFTEKFRSILDSISTVSTTSTAPSSSQSRVEEELSVSVAQDSPPPPPMETKEKTAAYVFSRLQRKRISPQFSKRKEGWLLKKFGPTAAANYRTIAEAEIARYAHRRLSRASLGRVEALSIDTITQERWDALFTKEHEALSAAYRSRLERAKRGDLEALKEGPCYARDMAECYNLKIKELDKRSRERKRLEIELRDVGQNIASRQTVSSSRQHLERLTPSERVGALQTSFTMVDDQMIAQLALVSSLLKLLGSDRFNQLFADSPFIWSSESWPDPLLGCLSIHPRRHPRDFQTGVTYIAMQDRYDEQGQGRSNRSIYPVVALNSTSDPSFSGFGLVAGAKEEDVMQLLIDDFNRECSLDQRYDASHSFQYTKESGTKLCLLSIDGLRARIQHWPFIYTQVEKRHLMQWSFSIDKLREYLSTGVFTSIKEEKRLVEEYNQLKRKQTIYRAVLEHKKKDVQEIVTAIQTAKSPLDAFNKKKVEIQSQIDAVKKELSNGKKDDEEDDAMMMQSLVQHETLMKELHHLADEEIKIYEETLALQPGYHTLQQEIATIHASIQVCLIRETKIMQEVEALWVANSPSV